MAEINEDKFKQMQDEMSRFEEEIGLPIPDVTPVLGSGPRVISAGTYAEAQKQLAGIGPPLDAAQINGIAPLVQPPPPPVPFIPHQVRAIDQPRPPVDMFRGPPIPPGPPMPGPPMPGGMGPSFQMIGPMGGPMGPGGPIGGPGAPLTGPPGPMGPNGAINAPGGPMGGPGGPMGPPGGGPMGPGGPLGPTGPPLPPPMMTMPSQFPGPMPPPGLTQGRFIPPPPPVNVSEKPQQPVPAVLSATPMMYVANPQLEIAAIQASNEHSTNSININNDLLEEKKNAKRTTTLKPAITTTVIETMIPGPNNKKKEKKNKKLIRTAGGQIWEDPTLAEWEDDDFRLFCGDLGNDVTDEVLTRAFSKYASFLKARVVRDKRTNKTKGFGFVSFKDPQDFIKATKEMNGRYVGSRPIKLRKSTWRNRTLDVVKKKEKEKANLISMLTGR